MCVVRCKFRQRIVEVWRVERRASDAAKAYLLSTNTSSRSFSTCQIVKAFSVSSVTNSVKCFCDALLFLPPQSCFAKRGQSYHYHFSHDTRHKSLIIVYQSWELLLKILPSVQWSVWNSVELWKFQSSAIHGLCGTSRCKKFMFTISSRHTDYWTCSLILPEPTEVQKICVSLHHPSRLLSQRRLSDCLGHQPC